MNTPFDNFIKQNESVFPRGLYNTDPCFEIIKGGIQVGFDSLFTKLKDAHESGCNVFLFEGYNGVNWEQIKTNTNNIALEQGYTINWSNIKNCLLPSDEIEK